VDQGAVVVAVQGVEQVGGADQVRRQDRGPLVLRRVGAVRGQVVDDVRAAGGDGAAQRVGVAQVAGVGGVASPQPGEAPGVRLGAQDQVDVVALGDEVVGQAGADEAAAAGDEDPLATGQS
jgi:hypothetical protein